MTYSCALSDPECKAEYHAKRPPKLNKKEKKEVAGMEAEDKNVLSIPVKKTRGRPKKYTTEEERKKAKTVKTVESNKRKRQEKMAGTGGGASRFGSLNNNHIDMVMDFLKDPNRTHTQDDIDDFRERLENFMRSRNISKDYLIVEFTDFINNNVEFPTRLKKNKIINKLRHFLNPINVSPASSIESVSSSSSDSSGRGMKGGMVGGNPPLTKFEINRLIHFITERFEKKRNNPKFERFIREELGEDNIVSRFADSILDYEIPNINEKDKKKLIPDLYDYVMYYFPQYKDSHLSITKLNGMRGGSVPHRPVKVRRTRSKSPVLPVQPTDTEIPPPPPPPNNTPTAPRQTNRRRINQGGKLISAPIANPLTPAQGMELLSILINPQGGSPYPITQARNRELRRVIEEIGGFSPIEEMADRFQHYVANNLHHSQREYIMDTYHRVLNYTPRKRKIEGGGVKRHRERSPSPITPLTDQQGNAIRDSLHHLNSPITPQMISHFGNIVSNIGYTNLRRRFQMYLEGFTHPPSVARFLTRFDRFLSLLQNEGAETDTEGGKLTNSHKDTKLVLKNNNGQALPLPITEEALNELLLLLPPTEGALPLPPTNNLRNTMVKKLSQDNVGYILCGIYNENGYVNVNYESYLELNKRLKKISTLLDIPMEETIDLFEEGLITQNVSADAANEIMDYLFKILNFGFQETTRREAHGRGLLEDLRKRELKGKHSISKDTIERLRQKNYGRLPEGEMIRQLEADIIEQFDANMNRFLEPAQTEESKTTGKGLIAGYSTEAPNGLSHIYPLSHANILRMCKSLS
jgi:hypothetical protein